MERSLRLLVPFVFLLAACRSFEFQSQQVFLRYEPEADVLDVLLVYEGVGATDAKETDGTSETLADIARGRRHFMVWDWPFDFDLAEIRDDMLEDVDDPKEEYAELMRAFLEYEPSIAVAESRFVRDRDVRLCLLQRLRFERASQALRLVDLSLNSLMLDEAGKDDGLYGDERTRALVLARARSGGAWARFADKALVISIPASSEDTALVLREWLPPRAKEPGADTITPQLFDSLSSLLVSGEEVQLTFAPDADGWIHFRLTDEGRDYLPSVAERLAQDGLVQAGDLEAEIRRLKETK